MVLTEQLLDAKLDAVEARTETKFAQLLGRLDLLVERVGNLKTDVGHLDGKMTIVEGKVINAKTTMITTAIATGIAVAALAWGGVQLFQGGMGITAAAYQSGADSVLVGGSTGADIKAGARPESNARVSKPAGK